MTMLYLCSKCGREFLPDMTRLSERRCPTCVDTDAKPVGADLPPIVGVMDIREVEDKLGGG
jgi:hypothetical protein